MEHGQVGAGESPRPRIVWLDGCRAYAIALVILVHSSQAVVNLPASAASLASLGQYGVQLFFVISAVTVFLTYSKNVKTGLPIGSWWVKRFFRIAPLYYCGILLYAALRAIKVHLGVEAPGAGPSSFDIMANVFFVHGFIPSANNTVVPGGWSIGVEMAFYAMAPLLYQFVVAGRTWLLGVIAVLMLALASWLNHGFGPSTYIYFSPFNQLPVLLISLVVCAVTRNWLTSRSPTPSSWRVIAVVAAPTGIFLTACIGTVGRLAPLLAASTAGIGFIGFIILSRGELSSLVANRLAQLVARLSYSLYIVHFAVLNVLEFLLRRLPAHRLVSPIAELGVVFAAAFAASLAIAALTYRLIERPGNALGTKLSAYWVSHRTKRRVGLPSA